MKLPYKRPYPCVFGLSLEERQRIADYAARRAAWEERIRAARALDDLSPADREKYVEIVHRVKFIRTVYGLPDEA